MSIIKSENIDKENFVLAYKKNDVLWSVQFSADTPKDFFNRINTILADLENKDVIEGMADEDYLELRKRWLEAFD